MSIDPLSLEWGTATPEFVSPDRDTAVHVFNHSLTTDEQLSRNILFIQSRIGFFASQLPRGMQQLVIFDDRGQDIPKKLRERLRESIQPFAHFEFQSERT